MHNARQNMAAIAATAGCMTALCTAPAEADTASVVRTTTDAVRETATVVEGRVVDVSFSFDLVAGPRTIATLTDLKVHVGAPLPEQIQVASLGGPLPDGRYLDIAELPRLRADSRYILFLTSSSWFFSPIVSDYAFRIEEIGGRDILVNQTGQPITFVSDVAIGAAALSVDAGNFRVLGDFGAPILDAEAPARSSGAISKETFLTIIGDIAATAPARPFQQHFSSERVWGIMPIAPDPEPAQASSSSSIADDGLICDSPMTPADPLICIAP